MLCESCNIQPLYLSCLTRLDKFTPSIYHVCHVLINSRLLFIMFDTSCNIQPFYLSCLPCLAIFSLSIYHVCHVLINSRLLFIMLASSCNIQPLYLSCLPRLDKFTSYLTLFIQNKKAQKVSLHLLCSL